MDAEADGGDVVLPPGSHAARAQEILKEAGIPLHVSEILRRLGKPQGKRGRKALASSLATYAGRSRVFTIVGPGVFGLLDMEPFRDSGKGPEKFAPIGDDDPF